MTTLHQDFESRSVLDIYEVGLDRYATDPTTEILMGAYAFDDGPVKLWLPHESDMPAELLEAVEDPHVIKTAWNSAFERAMYYWKLGIEVPITQWRDSMIRARYMALPGNLLDCSKALGLPVDEAKDADGTRLKNLFCMPAKAGGQETLFGISEPIFRDWTTDPVDWQLFCEYCRQDVVAERAIEKKTFDLPEREWQAWFLDQEINDRGILTDTGLVAGGSWIAETVKGELLERLGSITGLENPNSRDQMLGWARERGYPFHTLGKAFVNRALAGEGSLTPECKEALAIRQQAAKTSATKLVSIANQVSSDGRLRHQFSYFGASRTGRWSSGSGE